MSYAIRTDGTGWRAVGGPDDVSADETYSETQPALIVPDAASVIRAERVPLLAAADIAVNKAEDNGIDASTWRKYRQALRDLTDQEGFPDEVVWPEVPQ